MLCRAPKLLLLLLGCTPLLGRLGRALANTSDGAWIHSAMRVGWIAAHCVPGVCLALVSVQWGTAAAAGVVRAGIMPVGPAVCFTLVDAAVVWPAALIVGVIALLPIVATTAVTVVAASIASSTSVAALMLLLVLLLLPCWRGRAGHGIDLLAQHGLHLVDMLELLLD